MSGYHVAISMKKFGDGPFDAIEPHFRLKNAVKMAERKKANKSDA